MTSSSSGNDAPLYVQSSRIAGSSHELVHASASPDSCARYLLAKANQMWEKEEEELEGEGAAKESALQSLAEALGNDVATCSEFRWSPFSVVPLPPSHLGTTTMSMQRRLLAARRLPGVELVKEGERLHLCDGGLRSKAPPAGPDQGPSRASRIREVVLGQEAAAREAGAAAEWSAYERSHWATTFPWSFLFRAKDDEAARCRYPLLSLFTGGWSGHFASSSLSSEPYPSLRFLLHPTIDSSSLSSTFIPQYLRGTVGLEPGRPGAQSMTAALSSLLYGSPSSNPGPAPPLSRLLALGQRLDDVSGPNRLRLHAAYGWLRVPTTSAPEERQRRWLDGVSAVELEGVWDPPGDAALATAGGLCPSCTLLTRHRGHRQPQLNPSARQCCAFHSRPQGGHPFLLDESATETGEAKLRLRLSGDHPRWSTVLQLFHTFVPCSGSAERPISCSSSLSSIGSPGHLSVVEEAMGGRSGRDDATSWSSRRQMGGVRSPSRVCSVWSAYVGKAFRLVAIPRRLQEGEQRRPLEVITAAWHVEAGVGATAALPKSTNPSQPSSKFGTPQKLETAAAALTPLELSVGPMVTRALQSEPLPALPGGASGLRVPVPAAAVGRGSEDADGGAGVVAKCLSEGHVTLQLPFFSSLRLTLREQAGWLGSRTLFSRSPGSTLSSRCLTAGHELALPAHVLRGFLYTGEEGGRWRHAPSTFFGAFSAEISPGSPCGEWQSRWSIFANAGWMNRSPAFNVTGSEAEGACSWRPKASVGLSVVSAMPHYILDRFNSLTPFRQELTLGWVVTKNGLKSSGVLNKDQFGPLWKRGPHEFFQCFRFGVTWKW